jgi:hypothetical protein
MTTSNSDADAAPLRHLPSLPPELLTWYRVKAAVRGETPHALMLAALQKFADEYDRPAPGVTAMTEADALKQLAHHWGEAYAITHPAPGRWLAQRRDGQEWITAPDPDVLWARIAADYARQPVPRPR